MGVIRTFVFLFQLIASFSEKPPLQDSLTTRAVGGFRIDGECLTARCEYRERRRSPWVHDVVCAAPCHLRNQNANRMWYDWYSKQIKVLFASGEERCLRATPSQQLLVAKQCTNDNDELERFEYESNTQHFKRGKRCLSLIMKNTRDSWGKNENNHGLTVAECDDGDSRQRIEIPPRTFLGAEDKSKGYRKSCKAPLDIASGLQVMRASSSLNGTNATQGRLHSQGISWCANVSDDKQWLEVEMDGLNTITALEVQGGVNPNLYVKKIAIKYKRAPSHTVFRDFLDANEFDVSTEGVLEKSVKITFNPTFDAKVVRLIPTKWEKSACMRIELFGCASDAGDDGERGNAGLKGLQGPPGIEGIVGSRGEPGDKGEIGFKGIRGPPGNKGSPGNRGKAGPPGEPGFTGPVGVPGETGEHGELGLQGDQGLRGPRGAPGKSIPGKNGNPGPHGKVGVQGPKGVPGPDGHAGRPGAKGRSGTQGPKGKDGVQGSLGPIGYRGFPGPPGKNGKDGHKGKQGLKGERGERGAWTEIDTIIDQHVKHVIEGVEGLSRGIDELAIAVAAGLGFSVQKVLSWPKNESNTTQP